MINEEYIIKNNLKKFIFNNKIYYKSKKNIIYNYENPKIIIGFFWNDIKEIEFK